MMLKFKAFVNSILESNDYLILENDSDVIQKIISSEFNSIDDDMKKKMIDVGDEYVKSCGYDINSLMDGSASNVLTISGTVTKLRINGYSETPLTFNTELKLLKKIKADTINKIENDQIKKFNKANYGLCVILYCTEKDPNFVQFGNRN